MRAHWSLRRRPNAGLTDWATTTPAANLRPSFQYPELSFHGDSFRLLRLQPSSSDSSPIECKLFNARLSRWKERYVAISYTWGPPEPAFEIYVNGKPVMVRWNLYSLLFTYRDRKKAPALWIDALCIDQDSLDERNHQVGIMGTIYSSALRVDAWLGLAEEDSEWFLGQVNSYGQCLSEGDSWSLSSEENFRASRAAEKLLLRAYWTRIWIVQELVLAKDVFLLCGTERVGWNHLIAFLDVLDASEWTDTSILSSVDASRQDPRMQSFEKLFRRFKHMECALAPDKIYALLGMVAGQDKSTMDAQFEVDYGVRPLELLQSLLSCCCLLYPMDLCRLLAHAFGTTTAHLRQLANTSSTDVEMRLFRCGTVLRYESLAIQNQHGMRWKVQYCHVWPQQTLERCQGIGAFVNPDEFSPGDQSLHIDAFDGEEVLEGDFLISLASQQDASLLRKRSSGESSQSEAYPSVSLIVRPSSKPGATQRAEVRLIGLALWESTHVPADNNWKQWRACLNGFRNASHAFYDEPKMCLILDTTLTLFLSLQDRLFTPSPDGSTRIDRYHKPQADGR